MKTTDHYWHVCYTCPWFDTPSEKWFARDDRLACQQFVAELQQAGCTDARVHRPDDL